MLTLGSAKRGVLFCSRPTRPRPSSTPIQLSRRSSDQDQNGHWPESLRDRFGSSSGPSNALDVAASYRWHAKGGGAATGGAGKSASERIQHKRPSHSSWKVSSKEARRFTPIAEWDRRGGTDEAQSVVSAGSLATRGSKRTSCSAAKIPSPWAGSWPVPKKLPPST